MGNLISDFFIDLDFFEKRYTLLKVL